MKRLRLVITKKIDESLRMKAEENGIEVIEKEFIRIELLPVDDVRALTTKNITAIFTSKNAVRAVHRSIEDDSPIRWSIFCLAGATLNVVRKSFPLSTIAGTAWNAAELAEKIISLQPKEELVFFCGDKRRDDLPDALNAGDVPFKEIISYTTSLTPMKVEENFDAVGFFSPTAVDSFFSLNEINDDTLCFSVGSTTSRTLEKYAAKKILTLPEASEKSLIEEVIKIINQYNEA
jgi:uroporphyrinogen-III synthase